MPSNGCVIFAKNIENVSAFYQAVLKLSLTESSNTHHVLSGTDLELVIHGIPKKIADNIVIENPPATRNSAAIKPAFVVRSLTDVRLACEQSKGGLKPEKDTWDIRGAKVLDGWDPEGNAIQFKEFV